MASERHLPLSHRKVLTARLLFHEAVEPYRLQLDHHPWSRKTLKRWTEELASCTDESERSIKNDSIPLDTALKQIADELRRYIEGKLTEGKLTGPHSEFARVLKSFNEKVEQLSCETCSPLEQVCRGVEEDHQIVAEAGHCIDRLKELFSIAQKATLGYYRHYASLFPADLPGKMAFSTLYSMVKPHGFDIGIQAGGATEPPEGRPRSVRLVIHVEEFDRQTGMALLYILLHEWMVHAFQGALENDKSERRDYDAFAEGWMDWVVVKVLGEITAGIGPCASLAERCRHPEAFRDLGTDFHRARKKKRGTPYGSWIAYGISAAEKILGQMERLCGPDGWDRFLRLSFDLNLIPLSTAQRCTMVQKLYDHTPSRYGLHEPGQFERVPHILRRYLKEPDQVERLAQEMLAL